MTCGHLSETSSTTQFYTFQEHCIPHIQLFFWFGFVLISYRCCHIRFHTSQDCFITADYSVVSVSSPGLE